MAENTDEEHLDNPINNQSEIPADQIISPTDSETINPNHETSSFAEATEDKNKNMEVHHHAHDPAAPHHKKYWKSYFWEFFMLFLAVFCGFLAELELEHYIENQREKKYVTYLMQDLSKDSLNLSRYIKKIDTRAKRIDSVLEILINENIAVKGNDLYYYARQIIRLPNYFPSDASILQLKYSGNFRLIKNSTLVKQIGSYENSTREFIEALQGGNESNDKLRELLEFIFDGKEFYKMIDSKNNIIRPTNNPQLVNSNKTDINRLIMKLQFLKGGALRNIDLSQQLYTNCLNLLKEIRKKYDL